MQFSFMKIFIILLFSCLLIITYLFFNLHIKDNIVVKNVASPIAKVSSNAWKKIATKKYFFGHQSVGNNIIKGIENIITENPQIKINIFHKEKNAQLYKKGIFHQLVGKNTKPTTKLDDFEKELNTGLGESVDIAFLKFCYVDVNGEKNAAEIFSEYKSKIKKLKSKYPNITFIHFTMPIHTVDQSLLKGTLKRILSKGEFGANIERHKYNNMLKEYYTDNNLIFDVAYYESVSHKTGEVYQVTDLFGNFYSAMSEDNTYDGGHLNDEGEKWVAENFLYFLASLQEQRSKNN